MMIRLLHQLTNVEWLSMTFSGLVAYFVISRLLKGEPSREPITDALFKSGLIVLAIWKLSPLVLQPTLLLDETLNLFSFLLSTGTDPGLYLGVAAGVWFITYKIRKDSIPAVKITEVLPFGLLSGFVVFFLLNRSVGTVTEMPWGIAVDQSSYRYHPLGLYQLIFGIATGLLMIWAKRRGKSVSFGSFLLYFSLFQMTLTFFQYTTPYFLGLSLQQLFFIVVAALSIIFNTHKKEGKDIT